MSLDVRLTRGVNERWGFELFGGADDETTLIVQKIEQESPASRAGLQNGDAVLSINGEEAIDFSNEEACRRIAECGETITFGVVRGLYDPVLDDQEPIYYEPGDLDPQSQPTEVPFKIQQFLEPEDLGSSVINYDTNGELLGTPFDPSVLLVESRSLNASPFVNPTKPYRPFSTEPVVQVPPLEDPIILNPEYKDQFGEYLDDINPDYILNVTKNGSANKFKLPISEQYDPDGTRKTKNTEIDSLLSKYIKMEMLSKETKVRSETISEKIQEDVYAKQSVHNDNKVTVRNVEVKTENVEIEERNVKQQETNYKNVNVANVKEVDDEIIQKELSYIEQMKQDIDISQIENTAISVVEDSIERAISVAEEIKKEIEEEISTEKISKTESAITESEEKAYGIRQEINENQSAEHITYKEQSIEIKENMTKQEHMRNETKHIRQETTSNIQDEVTPTPVAKIDRKANYELVNAEEDEKSYSQKNQQSQNKSDIKKSIKIVTDSKAETSTAQKRTYSIGLQTIPNIRGVVQSSHHYDLLLKTFFIHLTDVMVALSRFVLTQPVFNAETHGNVSKAEMFGNSSRNIRTSKEEVFNSNYKVEKHKVDESDMQTELKQMEKVESTKKVVEPTAVQKKTNQIAQAVVKNICVNQNEIKTRELVTPVAFKDNMSQENVLTLQEQNTDETDISLEKKIKSGLQMAQRTERKLSKDVTQKMESVISEFQTIAVEGDKKEMFQRNRRSRSRSQIEEEVAKESDPLEWLSKVDSRRASQEISDERLTYKKDSSILEKTDRQHFQKHEIIHKKYKPPKQMYLAIVEAHVYTNKDVIFEDAAEFSETSSVQSADETNIASETLEMISTENVAIENAVQKIEHAKIIEDTQELAKINTQSTVTVRDIKETIFESNSFVQKDYKEKVASETVDLKEEIIQNSQNIIEPVVEIKELVSKEDIAVSIDESLSISKSSEFHVHESKNQNAAVEIKDKSTTIIDENYSKSTLTESTATETIHTESDSKDIDIKPELVIGEVSEKVIVKSQKEDIKVGEEYAALKIVKEVETEIESTNEIIEIEEVLDVSQDINQETVINKIEMSKELILDEAEMITENSVVSSEYGLNTSEVNSSKSIITSETDVSLSEETKLQNSSETHISNDVSSLSLQESSFTAQSIDRKLTLQIDLNTQLSTESASSTIDTPTPSTVPPTPITDEYVFKLTIPLPKSRGSTPVPRDCTLSPEDEDPHIVKKKLIPHIETTIEKVIFDPPLPTPPSDKVQSPIYKIPGLFGGGSKPLYKPVYRKPGLFGGADNPEYSKEEIREIERKSSLLASAIDETIKSIEEYKEEVGMAKKKELKIKEFKEERISKSYQETSNENTVIVSQQNGFIENNITTDKIVENGTNSDATIINNDSVTKIEEIAIDKALNSNVISESLQPEVAKEAKETIIESNEVKLAEELKTQEQKESCYTKSVDPIVQNGINGNYKVVLEEKQVNNSLETIDLQSEIKENGYKDMATEFNEIKNDSECKMEVTEGNKEEERRDPMLGFRPVVFEPEAIPKISKPTIPMQVPTIQEARQSPYLTESGDVIGTIQGIVDGLDEPVLDAEVAKELGKPGISEEKIAELISGEAEMLREAHVMGLSRVLNSHMHRADDSSVDFQKIKPMIGSLKDSEVLKALNEELARQKEEQRKKEEKRWTTFLQKPKRPVPKAKFGYHGWTAAEQALVEEPYKVKIVKQAKPKVAPDYKPEDFETGPLPWEERAEVEASLPPVEPEEPILIPEVPEFLEAVDPLQESEVPDLEDTGIPLPPPKEPTPPPEEPPQEEITVEEEPEIQVTEELQPEKEEKNDMENRLAEQLVKSVQSMVDPNATIEQQLSQMRAQLSALAQLPEVIQQTLELVSKQLNKMTHQETNIMSAHTETQSYQQIEVNQNHNAETYNLQNGDAMQNTEKENGIDDVKVELEDNMETGEQQIVQENRRVLQTPIMTEEDMKMEKMKKAQEYKNKLDSEGRQIKQRPTPRVGKPKRMFGPLDPDSRPVVLPGGRRWRKTEDVYNEQLIAETLQAQSELLQGKTMGFESDLLPYDERINFMKYEKPPVSLDHLQQSETYKLVHDMDQTPLKRVELLTPVIAEADYREVAPSIFNVPRFKNRPSKAIYVYANYLFQRCRSMTPSGGMKHLQIPQQFHP